MIRPIAKFGTYGFLCSLVAMQMSAVSLANSDAANDADRAVVDAKKSGRSVKRDVKKGVRKMTGKESKVEDLKDSAGDAVDNTKDEINHAKKSAE
jgi:hypothetical protein